MKLIGAQILLKMIKAENVDTIFGYPGGAAIDIYDALVTDRPYRKGMPLEKAIEILRQEANNNKLDQAVVNYLIEVVGDVEMVDAT